MCLLFACVCCDFTLVCLRGFPAWRPAVGLAGRLEAGPAARPVAKPAARLAAGAGGRSLRRPGRRLGGGVRGAASWGQRLATGGSPGTRAGCWGGHESASTYILMNINIFAPPAARIPIFHYKINEKRASAASRGSSQEGQEEAFQYFLTNINTFPQRAARRPIFSFKS